MAEANTLSLSQSALYKVQTRARLAEKLLLSPRHLKFLARGTQYKLTTIVDKNGKERKLQVPQGDLRKVHDRVRYLFTQLKAPDYLHSGVKGRSPVTNAREHRGGAAGMRVDVRKFFPSCSRLSLARFFHHEMGMAGDVAHQLSRLCTCNGALPTGSPHSMPLAFWMHRRVFDRIDRMARKRGYTFTLFVDDMTFSAEIAIPREFQLEIRSELRRVHLREHPRKTSRVTAGTARRVTGAILPASDAIRVPNDQRLKFLRGLEGIKANAGSSTEEIKSLRGLLAWMRQIEPNIFPRAGAELKRFQTGGWFDG